MTKHILQWFLFAATFFAAGAPAVGGGSGTGTGSGGDAGAGAGGSGGTGAGSGTGGQGSGTGTSQTGGTAQGGQQGQGGQGEVGLRQLREQYEALKAQHEPYTKLNLKPEQITQYSQFYQNLHTEAGELGRDLGFSEEEVAEAFAQDPVATVNFLRSQASRAEQRGQEGQQGDLRQQMEQIVQQTIGPIQQRENLRMTNEANSLFERTVYQESVNFFKGQGIEIAKVAPEELQTIMDAASEAMKYEDADVKALKFEGKTAGVQKAFKEAINFLDRYYLARSNRERAHLGPANRGGNNQGGQQGGNQQGRKPTLDEIINGEASAEAAMPSMRR